jgi:microcystin-dependent protein
MDRNILTIGEQFNASDFCQTNKNAYIALAKLAMGILGSDTLLNGLECTANSPPDLNVQVAAGEIYQMAEIDATAYGDLPVDTHEILKSGINLDPIPDGTFTFTAPVTPGDSVNYLIEFSLLEADVDDENREFYNAAPQVVPTIRKDSIFAKALAGTPAPTGTQTTPSVEVGFVGGWVVTIAYGQTTITGGDITEYTNAPFITEKLKDKISQAFADLRYGQITTIQNGGYVYAAAAGTANTYTASLTPAITAYTAGMIVNIKINTANTGASTINLNSLGVKDIKLLGGIALVGDEMPTNMLAELNYDGTQFILLNPSHGATTPTGTVVDFAGATPPANWLMCDGSALSRITYAALFSVIGTSWGIGDGSSTFNIPDVRGRTAIGSGTGSGLTARTLGQTGGEETHLLTIPEMPAHTHSYSGGIVPNVLSSGGGHPQPEEVGQTTGSTGGGGAHNNMQPFAVFNKIIKC